MFKFDFNVVQDDDVGAFSDKKESSQSTQNDENKDPEIQWYDSKEITLTEKISEHLDLYKANSMEKQAGEVNLTYMKSGFLLQQFDESDETKDITKAEQIHSDLIPGIYEGGAKIWECTDDLISYMSTHYPPKELKGKRILDLGCGSGVLGIYAYACGAIVHFQDYNQDVIEKITIPNVMLNLPEDEVNELENVKFYSGDWSKYVQLTKDDEKFVLILTSETIYNPRNQQKLLDTFDSKLKEDGVVLLAAKVYYFGVGGGIRQFEEILEKDKRFKSRILWNSEEGLKREIIEIKRITE